MIVKNSSCYYHVGEIAVATCTHCGVDICKNCAVKDFSGKVICPQCANKMLKEDHKLYKKQTKGRGGLFSSFSEFVLPGIIGILIVVAILIIKNYNKELGDIFSSAYAVGIEGRIGMTLFLFMLFSVPFGVVGLNYIFSPTCDTAWGQFFIGYLKFMVALFLGWAFFLFYFIRYIIYKIRFR